MLNENAKKWVAALRSGEYQKTKEQLYKDGAYCCLGVACAISPVAPDGWKHLSLLPEEVMDWLGLFSRSGYYKGGYLTSDNDERNHTFAEIADIIESEPRGLFSDS